MNCIFFSPLLCQVAGDSVTRMRQEVESLDRKTKNLVKSFHSYFKMKGELSCADTLMLLHEKLKKRMCCRTICQDLQVLLHLLYFLLIHTFNMSSVNERLIVPAVPSAVGNR